LVEPGREPLHLAAEAREVFDVSGAGDTSIATLAAALAVGADLPRAARLANTAAGIAAGKLGTAVVHPADLLGAIQARTVLASEAKVVALESALERIQRWRAKGERVAFTNGCFDLIHPGHVSLLGQARAAADRLVVGLNSDASVKRLKGPERPVQNETARGIVLASLASVDLVLVFDEDTPIELIRAIRPEVLVKGADYRLDQVVGADVVQSYGGRVVLADLLAGHSTTGTIARVGGGRRL
jgi:D-beta-D-heptose 7-phosphate kinase/D-beta-D-heptose 1-phosphate adenosyltransferase